MTSANSSSQLEPANPKIKSGDVVIALMGVTGAGKTTFIQHFTRQKLEIGHGLESCTVSVAIHECPPLYSGGQKFFLVDTPGFDDTYRSDTQILTELADWLSVAYQGKILLTGIIYLHRILDVRLGGAALKNLNMFKKLCGDNTLGSVVLATTFWGQVSAEEGQRRESQMKERQDFWKGMIDKGSTVLRQDDEKESARRIVQYLIKRRQPQALQIQVDMVDKGMALNETAAGKELQAEIARLQAENEMRLKEVRKEMKEALARADEEHQQELAKYKKEIKEKIERQQRDATTLRMSKDDLKREIEAEFRRNGWRRKRKVCVVM